LVLGLEGARLATAQGCVDRYVLAVAVGLDPPGANAEGSSVGFDRPTPAVAVGLDCPRANDQDSTVAAHRSRPNTAGARYAVALSVWTDPGGAAASTDWWKLGAALAPRSARAPKRPAKFGWEYALEFIGQARRLCRELNAGREIQTVDLWTSEAATTPAKSRRPRSLEARRLQLPLVE
jgi:hypothetical protein